MPQEVVKLTPNFAEVEFLQSRTAYANGVDMTPPPAVRASLKTTAQMMEKVRALCGGSAVLITSGYRPPIVDLLIRTNPATGYSYTKAEAEAEIAAGRSPRSAHTRGMAADFHVPGYGSPYDVARLIRDNLDRFPEVDQLIWEGTWVHLAWDPSPRRDGNRVLTIQGHSVRFGIG